MNSLYNYGFCQTENTKVSGNLHDQSGITSNTLHVKKHFNCKYRVQNESDCHVSPAVSNLNVPETKQQATFQDPLMSKLKQLRSNYGKNLIFAHVNINGLGQKREYVKEICIKQYIDVLCVSESKLSERYVDHE